MNNVRAIFAGPLKPKRLLNAFRGFTHFTVLAVTAAVISSGCASNTSHTKPAPAASGISKQIQPQWINESWRNAHYPASEWYTGFSEDRITEHARLAQALERAERSAQSKMVEAITVRISSSSTVETSSRQRQMGQNVTESINRNYMKSIEASTTAEINKSEVRSFHDAGNGRVYAFATVRKKDLADFYRSRITDIFAFANREFVLIEQLMEQDRIKAAAEKIDIIEDSLKSVPYWSSVLQIVVSDSSHAETEMNLWQKLNDIKVQLQSGITIFLDISGDNDLVGLAAEIQAKDANSAIVNEMDSANYVVTVSNELSRCENSGKFAFCYVNVVVVVNNQKTGRTVNVKIPEIKGGWGNNNQERALIEAYKTLIKNVSTKIVETIHQP